MARRCAAACAALVAVGALAAVTATPIVAAELVARAADLADLSLEQLSNIVVTSVARRPESLASAAASVYVITAEEIRRSGAISIPEALRLAPNLDVARADANQYAISARGFTNVLANELLVLIVGRAVYTPNARTASLDPVPAYTALDLHYAWHPSPTLEVAVTGQNLLDARHGEWQNRAELARGVFLKVTWTL